MSQAPIPQASAPRLQSFTLDQLNSTSLKWGSDGELSQLDHQRILQLLCQADPVAESLISSFEPQTLDGSQSSV